MMDLWILLAVALLLVIALVTAAIAWQMTHPKRRSYAVAVARGLPGDPSEIGLQAAEITIVFDDYQQTNAWIIQGDCPTGPVVILTHGWANSRYGIMPLAKKYTPFAARIVIYDVRAQGDSSATWTSLGPREADDLLTVMKYTHINGKPFVLFGSSLGAAIVMRTMEQLQSQHAEGSVRGVILEGAYLSDQSVLRTRLRLAKVPHWPMATLACLLLRTFEPRYGTFDALKIARQLKCPMLILHGEHDDICPVSCAGQLAAAAENATLVEIPGGRHSRLAECDEKRYTQAVTDFMQKLNTASP